MSRDSLIKINNDLLQNVGDFTLWVELISDFVNEKDPSKHDQILKIFPTLPQPIQIQLVKVALEYFNKKFTVCSLSKEDVNTGWIINGEPQKIMKVLYYF